MNIEVPWVISFLSLLVAFFAAVKSNKRSDTTEVEKRATEQAVITTKLDEINGNVKEIRADVKATQSNITAHDVRIAELARDVKSAHNRLDTLEKKVGGA